MTTQDKKDSVQVNDAVAKKPRKPSTKNVATTVPEVDATEVNFISVKHHNLKKFMDSLVSVGDKEYVEVSCHSKPDMVDAGYSVITTNVFNTVKDALVNNRNVYYRDISAKVDSINYGGIDADNVEGGIAYILTGAATHLCFIISAGQNKVVLPDADVKYVVDAIAHALGYTLGVVKQEMINAFLEQSKNMKPEQETNNMTDGVQVMVVEQAKQFHDETQFVLRAIDSGITKNPGLEVVYMSLGTDIHKTPNNGSLDVCYSIMFTNRFDTLVDVLKFGDNTTFVEGRSTDGVACGMGGVTGYDDTGAYKEYHFIAIDLGDKFKPETFNDVEFLKLTVTHAKWAFASVERYRARRMYEVQDKGDTTMLENQTLNVTEMQQQTMDAVMTELGSIFDTPNIRADLKINADYDLEDDGYNILYTDNFKAVVDVIGRLDNAVVLPICHDNEECAWKHAAVVAINNKKVGQVIFYVIEEHKDIVGRTNPVLQDYIDAVLHRLGTTHDKVTSQLRLTYTQKFEENSAPAIPKGTLDLDKQIEMVDKVIATLGDVLVTEPGLLVKLCINRNADLAKKGYNVLYTNNFKAIIGVLDIKKEAGQLPINNVDFSVAVAGTYVDHQLIRFYVVEELGDIEAVEDIDLYKYITVTLFKGLGVHQNIMETVAQKLGQKFIRRSVEEIDALEAIEDVQKGKVKASDEQVTVIRRQVPVEPIANSKPFPPFQGAQRSVGDAGRQGLGRGVVMHQHYGVFGEPPVMEFDNKRYNRHTYPNEVSERFSDVRIYDHTPRYHFGEGSVLAIVRDFMMKHNMPSIPTRDSLDNGEDQFTRELCRLENGSVVWNRAAMLTVPSCRQNKKEGKGVNHYMLSVRDDERREFVICIYADYTNRKRPSFVVNYFEILEGDAKPCVGSVVSHLEHVLRN